MGMLRIHKKGYTDKNGVRHKPTSYLIKDKGTPGRGRKVLPKLKKGTLGKGYFSKDKDDRHMILRKKGKQIGERKLAGKLVAIEVLNKRTNPKISRKAKSDAHYVHKKFQGRKYVK